MQIDHADTVLNDSPIIQTNGNSHGMEVRIYKPDKKGNLKLKKTVTARLDNIDFRRLSGLEYVARLSQCESCGKDYTKKQTRTKRCDSCRVHHNRTANMRRARKKAYDAKRKKANAENH